jgi:hypothetical protein
MVQSATATVRERLLRVPRSVSSDFLFRDAASIAAASTDLLIDIAAEGGHLQQEAHRRIRRDVPRDQFNALCATDDSSGGQILNYYLAEPQGAGLRCVGRSIDPIQPVEKPMSGRESRAPRAVGIPIYSDSFHSLLGSKPGVAIKPLSEGQSCFPQYRG